MQIKTVHQLQNVFDKTTKVVKFAWRHFFVLNLLHCLFIAFIEAPSVNWDVFATYLFIATFLDWLKTKIKFSANHATNVDKLANAKKLSKPRFYSGYGTQYVVGSPAYISSIGDSFKKYH